MPRAAQRSGVRRTCVDGPSHRHRGGRANRRVSAVTAHPKHGFRYAWASPTGLDGSQAHSIRLITRAACIESRAEARHFTARGGRWHGGVMITGSHAIIYAEDAEKARAFFRDVLDFPY